MSSTRTPASIAQQAGHLLKRGGRLVVIYPYTRYGDIRRALAGDEHPSGGAGEREVLGGEAVDGHVVLADINAAMLKQGRSRLIDAGVAGNLSIAQVDAQHAPVVVGARRVGGEFNGCVIVGQRLLVLL